MVSIIITLYNKQNTIDCAIQSALNQSYSNCEVIVIDDCSTDNSSEIYAKYGDKIRVIKSDKNRGLPYSRQIGIKHAQGQFITFIDADDYLGSKSIERCIEKQKITDADIVQMKISRRIGKFDFVIPFRSKYDSSKVLDACLYNEHLFPVQCWGKLYKTDLLKTIPQIEYNGFWGEDRIFNISIMANNPTIAVAEKAKYNYSWGGITSSNFDINALQEYKQVYQIKYDWAIANGYEHHIPSMQKELLELLKYHVRHLINSCSMSDTLALSWLNTELLHNIWQELKNMPTAERIYFQERSSIKRILKKTVKYVIN